MFGLEGTQQNAIAYYRHSAEDKQENSVAIQHDHALIFAKQHSLNLMHYESDEGVSGLSASRPGFERLFDNWITNPDAPDFRYVLVLDETRWGRWQDPDEAAYWTMICKKHGKQVVYISRGFPKEEQKLLSSLETSIGRYMAAEYSRQLSDKVWHGSMKVSEQGFSAGGTAPYGYARVLLDEKHNRIGVLRKGEHKVIANQRVTFEPADDNTPRIVFEIFDLFVNYWASPAEIAERLNERGVLSATGKTWDASKVLRVLSNEAYTGTRVYNKTWHRLKQKQRQNPRDEWVRSTNAFEAIVSQDMFQKAQERMYWSSSSRWRYGVHKISKSEKQLRTYVDNLLQEYSPDQRFEILRNLPLTFGLVYHKNSTTKRCFRVDHRLRKHDEILGISIDMFANNSIESIFALPASMFGIGNFVVVDDQNLHSIKKLDGKTARDTLLRLCDKFIT